jgi:hypothetical protein
MMTRVTPRCQRNTPACDTTVLLCHKLRIWVVRGCCCQPQELEPALQLQQPRRHHQQNGASDSHSVTTKGRYCQGSTAECLRRGIHGF